MKPVILVLVVFYIIEWLSEYNYYAAKSVYVYIITTHLIFNVKKLYSSDLLIAIQLTENWIYYLQMELIDGLETCRYK